MNDIHFTKLIYFVVNLNLRAMEWYNHNKLKIVWVYN